MKYHKIAGVEKAVCTAEQKIAYNLAFRAHIANQAEFDRVNAINPGQAKSDCSEIARKSLINYKKSCDYTNKHAEDAIFCALNAGLYNYMCKPFVASNYEQIGEAFPANY